MELCCHLDFRRTIGVIAEVKTGEVTKLFPHSNVNACVDRLGFVADTVKVKKALNTDATCLLGDDKQIAKVLFANGKPKIEHCVFISLNHCREFLINRIKKYLDPKYGNRMFFNSSLLQEIIWQCRNDSPP